MNNSDQKPCQCEKAACACAEAKVERCTCGDDCNCTRGCNCTVGCDCLGAK